MSWVVPLVIAAYGAYQTYQQSKAASTAAGLQAGASAASIAEARRQFDESQAFSAAQWNSSQRAIEPYVRAGQGAVSKLSSLLGVEGVSPNNWTAQPYSYRPGGGSASGGDPTDPAGNAGHTPIAGQNMARSMAAAPVISASTLGYEPDSMHAIGYPVGTGASGKTYVGWEPDQATVFGRNPPRHIETQTLTPGWIPNHTAMFDPEVTRAAGRTVQMTAPDGTVSDVPEEYVDYYALRGATVGSTLGYEPDYLRG